MWSQFINNQTNWSIDICWNLKFRYIGSNMYLNRLSFSDWHFHLCDFLSSLDNFESKYITMPFQSSFCFNFQKMKLSFLCFRKIIKKFNIHSNCFVRWCKNWVFTKIDPILINLQAFLRCSHKKCRSTSIDSFVLFRFFFHCYHSLNFILYYITDHQKTLIIIILCPMYYICF